MTAFEITLQRKYGDTWPVVAEQEFSGVLLPVRSEGELQLDLDELETISDPWIYGETLGRALFQGDISEALVNALSEARRQEVDQRLRVLLYVEDASLRRLHWERLAAKMDGEWTPLGLSHSTPFSQYLPSRIDRRFPPLSRRDLKVLALVASPHGLEEYRLSPFDALATTQSLKRALGEIEIDWLGDDHGATANPTLDELCVQFKKKRYTMLHIVCHGFYTKDSIRETRETALLLADQDGNINPVTGTEFINRLRLSAVGGQGLPYFVFLSTCDSALPDAESGLGGLGQRLVRELGIPAVVAMTGKISIATAEELARDFYTALTQHGELDRALVEATIRLTDREDISMPALFSRLGTRPLFSDTLERNLTHDEIRRGLKRLLAEIKANAPDLIDDQFEVQVQKLENLLNISEKDLTRVQEEERKAILDYLNQVSGEGLDVSFAYLALNQPVASLPVECPFRGLFPFHLEDRKYFFGREPLVETLYERLNEQPFLAVLGPSGCGKSSLVFAGLLPRLQKDHKDLVYESFTPGEKPSRRLKAAVKALQDQKSDPEDSALLIVDQFEELFTQCDTKRDREKFVIDLLDAVSHYLVVITMRADFWGECAPLKDLKDIMTSYQELIPPMDANELRAAMELQAASVGLDFEAGLSADILEDVRGEPGAMPLLQHALLLLWEHRRGRWLRLQDYQSFGGVANAITHSADDIYNKLPEKQQERLREIFLRLTRLDEEVGLGGERRDTRRRIPLKDLIPADRGLKETHDLVARLADKRLVVTSTDPQSGLEMVEVAHEALIRSWERLKTWLEKDREALVLRDRVRREAQEWSSNQEDESYLVLRGRRLQASLVLRDHPRLDLNKLELRYLEESQKADIRSHQWAVDVHARLEPNFDYVGSPNIFEIEVSQPGNLPRLSSSGSFISYQTLLDPLALEALEADPRAYGKQLEEMLFPADGVPEQLRTALSAVESGCHIQIWLDPAAPHLRRLAWSWLLLPQKLSNGMEAEIGIVSVRLDTRGPQLRSLKEPSWLISTILPVENKAEVEKRLEVFCTATSTSLETTLRFKPDGGLIEDQPAYRTKTNLAYLLAPVNWQPESLQRVKQALKDIYDQQREPPRLVILDLLPVSLGEVLSGEQRQQLMELANDLVLLGTPAMLALPPGLPSKLLPEFINYLFQSLNGLHQIDNAVAHARVQLAEQLGDWAPLLYHASDDGTIWYQPGFSGGRITEKWPAIIETVYHNRITFLLGPRLSEPLWGSPGSIGRLVGEEHDLGRASEDEINLPRLFQEVAITASRGYLIDYYTDILSKKIFSHHSLLLEDSGVSPADPIDEIIGAAWSANRLDGLLEAYQLLVELPVAVYLNANPDNLLSMALREAGKEPVEVLAPWQESLEMQASIYDIDPDYRASPERPLLVSMYGKYSQPESLVLTDDDYLDFLTGLARNIELLPTFVRQALASSSLVFLGFRPEARQFQSLFRFTETQSGGYLRRRYSHHIQLEPPPDVDWGRYQRMQELYFESSSIDVYWGSISDFTDEFRQNLQELKGNDL